MTKELADASLALLFTKGVSLQTWVQAGFLEREMALYRRLDSTVGKVSFVTYGGRADLRFADEIRDISLLSTYDTGSSWLNHTVLRLLHGGKLRAVDVVKTNQIMGADLGVRLKRSLGCRLVTRCGYLASAFAEREFPDAHVRRVRELEEQAFSEADLGVVTTEKARQRVLSDYRLDSNRVRVVPNFVDIEHFRPVPKEASVSCPSLVCVGRLAPQKNLEALLDALHLVKLRQGAAPRLTIVGQGELRRRLETKSRELALEVEFPGVVPSQHLPGQLQQADVFVLPSLYEGHPKALLEAMACGLPCVGTRVDGIAEELEHGVNGFLCETDAESLADAIETVIADPELRLQLGRAARHDIVQKYSLDRVAGLEADALRTALA